MPPKVNQPPNVPHVKVDTTPKKEAVSLILMPPLIVRNMNGIIMKFNVMIVKKDIIEMEMGNVLLILMMKVALIGMELEDVKDVQILTFSMRLLTLPNVLCCLKGSKLLKVVQVIERVLDRLKLNVEIVLSISMGTKI